MGDTIRVLLADEHPLVREGVRATLERTTDIEVVAETDTTHALIPLCHTHHPTIVLLEVQIAGPPLLTTVASMRVHCSFASILILSSDPTSVALRAIQKGNVAAYVLKTDPAEILTVAIYAVARGKTWYSPPIQQAIASVFAPHAPHGLTAQESEILDGILNGLSSSAIGRRLNLAEQTVRNYTSRIYEKLGVPSRATAALWAVAHGVGAVR